MTRGVLARVGFALLLLLGTLAVAAVDDPGTQAVGDTHSALERSAVIASDAPGDEPVSIASVRWADDSRSSSSRLVPIALVTAMVGAAAVAWHRHGRPHDVSLARRASTGTRRRAPPLLRCA